MKTDHLSCFNFASTDVDPGIFPETVASHFDAAGVPNGYMPRSLYVRVLLAITILLPAALVLTSGSNLSSPGARINLPNRDYWLAPERREETIGAVSDLVTWIAMFLVGFLVYTHALVIRAHESVPVRLPAKPMIAGLCAFVVLSLGSAMAFVRRFRDVPGE